MVRFVFAPFSLLCPQRTGLSTQSGGLRYAATVSTVLALPEAGLI